MNLGLAAGTALFVIAILLGIAQLWLAPWLPETFAKIELTIGGLLGIVIVVWFVLKEQKEDRANRSGNRLDQ
jgi:hypothetical protein